MKLKNKTALAIMALALISSESYSAPNISSASNNGGNITITGSGFGIRSNYGGGQPFLNKAWTNFESGVLTGGNITMGSYPQNWRVGTTNNRTNSKKYAEKFYSVGELGALEIDQSGTPREWFASFWIKMLSNNQSGKFFRIYGSNGNIFFSTGGPDYTIRAASEGADGPTQWGSPNSLSANAWHKFEVYMSDNPKALTVWLDGVEQWSRPDLVPTNFGANGHTIDIGNMIDGPERGYGVAGSYSYDDVFIDHTRARVELGNTDTWSNSTIREVQIPTAWSDGSITVNINKGSFTTGTAYLFVVDSAGNASKGYPITLSAGNTTNTLSAPKNLQLTAPSN
ncbi:MAG TPA: hypothetical protein PK880_05875 [Candidatus Competibacter sp.]|nr:hypothetical protein [Candidatus Competibacter sp.]